jgi:DNA-binding MarR family transcriptional regulator
MATNTGPAQAQEADAPALLRDVARLHVRAQRALLAREEASTTQCTILTELGRAEPATLAELTRRLRLDKGWTSRAVDQLVDEGLVDKAASDADRRSVALSLTRSGTARHRRLETLLNDQVARVIERIPRAERASVARALRLLHLAYVAELAEPDGDAAGLRSAPAATGLGRPLSSDRASQ